MRPLTSPQVKIVVEHLEPELSDWLLYEYENASRIVGVDRLMFTNVPSFDVERLKGFGEVRSEHVWELFNPEDLVVLDPQAPQPLQPEDVKRKKVVIGGILGDNPPRGRTMKLLTSKIKGVTSRNIGVYQFSIDGSAYIAKRVIEGCRLEAIAVRRRLTIKVSRNHLIMLPYAFPLHEGKPVISPKLITYLRLTDPTGYLR
ncbi:MAG: SAM-dependent methyltransferase [Candidatus Nezhaarchaeales archaeon]